MLFMFESNDLLHQIFRAIVEERTTIEYCIGGEFIVASKRQIFISYE